MQREAACAHNRVNSVCGGGTSFKISFIAIRATQIFHQPASRSAIINQNNPRKIIKRRKTQQAKLLLHTAVCLRAGAAARNFAN
jgi:hypothetical protein